MDSLAKENINKVATGIMFVAVCVLLLYLGFQFGVSLK